MRVLHGDEPENCRRYVDSKLQQPATRFVDLGFGYVGHCRSLPPASWCQTERASLAPRDVKEVVKVAERCPSGAIRYERLDGGPAEAPPVVNLVRVRENGPLAFHAELRVEGDTRYRATLCRCGASKNKPYCDGQHAAAGFVATGEPSTRESPALAVRNGPLEVTPTKDGPLRARGSLEIVSGTGRTIEKTAEAWLCRCGASANKPYCDGSHRKIGFVADGT